MMMPNADEARPPSPFLLLAEWRALPEFGAFLAALPLLRALPRGDGRPVLVLPGLAAGDGSTLPLRRFLEDRGYACYGWNLGRNVGFRPGLKELKERRLAEIHRRHGEKVALVGWSLGGIYARQLAKAMPDAVREVISLGSPFKGDPRSSNAWQLYEALAGHTVDEVRLAEEIAAPPPVPFTSIYSKTDGVVAWECCIERAGPMAENVGVEGSHCGLGHNPMALYVIADRLAQAEGAWKPFDASAAAIKTLHGRMDWRRRAGRNPAAAA